MNISRAGRVELERAARRVGGDDDLVLRLRGGQRRVGGLGQRLEEREVGQRRDQAAGHDDRLAADLVGQRAEHDEERRADQQRRGDQDVGRGAVDLQRCGQEEQRVELARVPDHRLAGGQAEQRQEHDLQVLPLAEGFGQRRLRGLALLLHLLEGRRLVHRQPDPDRDRRAGRPTPGTECASPSRRRRPRRSRCACRG